MAVRSHRKNKERNLEISTVRNPIAVWVKDNKKASTLVLTVNKTLKLLYHRKVQQMTFFPEVNIEKTKANAKRKLKEYPRWRRVANDVDGQKVTAVYTFEPRQTHGNPSRPVERLAINRVDAEAELEAIEYAINNLLNPTHRRILYEKYLYAGKRYDFEIYNDLYLSEASFYIELNDALLSFAEQYRSGVLLVQN